MDVDVYGHVNNVVYYSYFDTVINRWLIAEGGLDIREGAVIGVCAESMCRFFEPLSFFHVLKQCVVGLAQFRGAFRHHFF